MSTVSIILLVLFLSFSNSVFAESSHHDGMKHGHHQKHGSSGHHGKHHRGKGSKGSVHLFTEHWAKTLSDKQKRQIDQMHLKVGQFEAVQRAKLKVLKAELAVMSANSSTKQKDMYGKIDQIMEVKKLIMRNRYDHIVEMREVLTKDQRLSYDAGLLADKKHKH